MNLRLAVLFLALLPCCLLADERPYYVKLANELVKKHILEMGKEGFLAYMRGGGMMHDVKNISVGLELGRTPTLEEARILYVRGVERLLKRVNQDPQIRPYLRNYPFTVSNLTYRMQFPQVAVDASGTGPIVDIMCVRGRVYYDVLEPNNGRGDLRAMHIEPYADALRIVRESGALDDLTER